MIKPKRKLSQEEIKAKAIKILAKKGFLGSCSSCTKPLDRKEEDGLCKSCAKEHYEKIEEENRKRAAEEERKIKYQGRVGVWG